MTAILPPLSDAEKARDAAVARWLREPTALGTGRTIANLTALVGDGATGQQVGHSLVRVGAIRPNKALFSREWLWMFPDQLADEKANPDR